MRFSANLGFLWTELPLPEAIHAAKTVGFDAVECHFPYDVPASDVKAALNDTGLPMLGLNTWWGDAVAGDFGLAAVPGREDEARRHIEEAMAYAGSIGAEAVHVLAGNAAGPEAHAKFIAALEYAIELAQPLGVIVLIEPLNAQDAPNYFLRTTEQARAIIDEVGAPSLKLMFDCYHVARTEGDVEARFAALQPIVGHVQFAGVPHRSPPDQSDLDYAAVFKELKRLGWSRPLGAEYRPFGPTEASLGWMHTLV